MHLPSRFYFGRHLAAFVVIVAVLVVADIVIGGGLALFWPLGAWSVLLAIHYFIASAYDVDEAWVDEKIMDLRTRSYDFDHIQNIEQRVKDKDRSVTARIERDRRN
jgi:hypothetical protein